MNVKFNFKWEKLEGSDYNGTERCAVIGGWIVCRTDNQSEGHSISMVFIPDVDHQWEIDTFEEKV